MLPIIHRVMYQTPVEYQPPDDTELITNTQYPNLNSRDYGKRALNRNIRMHIAWDCIDLNREKHAVIATNKFYGRDYNGSVWGFEDIDKLSPEQSCYKLQCDTNINKLKFVSSNILLIAFNSGKVQLWSTHSEVRNATNPYCLFLIGEKNDHPKPVTAMDVDKNDSSMAFTGDEEGTLKVWDMGSADLQEAHTFRYAHTATITSIDSSASGTIFATCSLDKSALLWDYRMALPALAISENHKVRYKAAAWSSPEQNLNENIIHLGDESGYINTVDIRHTHAFVQCKEYFNKPIKKILPQSNMLAVIANSNIVKISTGSEHEVIYENAGAREFVRDCIWHNSKTLLTIGFDGKLSKHKIE